MELAPGIKIKQYTLEQLLGRGASGEVWRATDGTKLAAVKFMNEALMKSSSAPKHRQRLEREIKALSTITHPNITRLYDYDMSSERPYLIMEYVDSPSYEYMIVMGEMLRVRIGKRLEMMTAIAGALTAAHDAGIFHRDIKPGNMHGVDKPYLLDFSIALEEEDIERTNFNIGTTIYMPPDEEPPDRLSDNFSFAVVTYEVLFGAHPIFPPNDKSRSMGAFTRLQTYNRLRNRDWRFPSRITKEELPPDMRGVDLAKLDAIFEKAMSARNIRYLELGQFMFELKKAIIRPENVPYADKPALKPMVPGVLTADEALANGSAVPDVTPIPPDEDFTKVEAERAQAQVGSSSVSSTAPTVPSKPSPKIEIRPKTETIAPPQPTATPPAASAPAVRPEYETPPVAQPVPYHPTITPILENEEPERPSVIPRVLMTNLDMEPIRIKVNEPAPRTIRLVWVVIGVLLVMAVFLLLALFSRGGL
jgi:serine/threonine protein kinase